MSNPDDGRLAHLVSIETPEYADWSCHLFGSDPDKGNGFVYRPTLGTVPNALVRYMMGVCLGCRWVRDAAQVKTKSGNHQ